MGHLNSADGTVIAVHAVGNGPVVVIVNGAFSTAGDAAELAQAFADSGMRAVTYDRRARAGSGDGRPEGTPVDPQREVEDLAAVVAAVGGDVAVLGHSSGAVLALFAASEGVEMNRLFLSEPPFHFGENEPAADLPERLQQLVDDERETDAVILFQREAVGLPDEVIEQIRQSPLFEVLARLAQSTVYDATLTRAVSTPTDAMLAVTAPVTILCGVETFPLLTAAARRLSEAMPAAELLETPESVGHRLDVATAVRVVTERLA